MKPVRRNIRRHFGLTAKQVAVRSQRPWYFRLVLAAVCVGFGFGLAYWLLHDNESENRHIPPPALSENTTAAANALPLAWRYVSVLALAWRIGYCTTMKAKALSCNYSKLR